MKMLDEEQMQETLPPVFNKEGVDSKLICEED